MSRKRAIIELAPMMYGYGFTLRQIGLALNCSHVTVHGVLRDLGVIPKRAPTLEDAMRRLTPNELERVRQANSVS